MTNTDKWEEFLEWWDKYHQLLEWVSYAQKDTVVARLKDKIEELRRKPNAKQ